MSEQPVVRFAPAIRKGSHVLIALYGFSGCGKTLSALYLARGIAGNKGRVGMLDTESGRGLTYADEPGLNYEYAELPPPFTAGRYVAALRGAADAKLDVLILDSGSHEWEGIGGVLETAEAARSSTGAPLAGLVKWAKPKAEHKRFVQALLGLKMHVIVCLRAKERLVQVKDGPKRGEIVSEGFTSIQDKRFIYETTVQVFLPTPAKPTDKRGVPVIEKCPRALLSAFRENEQISIETGRRIAAWVGAAEKPAPAGACDCPDGPAGVHELGCKQRKGA